MTYGMNGSLQFSDLSHNCQFHHRRLESLEHFIVLFIIYNSEHYGLIFDLKDAMIFFYKVSIFLQVHLVCVYNVI